MTSGRRSLRRLAIGCFVVIAIAFFALALVDAWDATDGELPSVPRFAASLVLACIGLLSAAFAWVRLLGSRDAGHGSAFLVSQLSKYVPGGIWQATAQVGLARSSGVAVRRAVAALTVSAVTQIVAGSTFLPLLAFDLKSSSPFLRLALLFGGLLALTLLDRRWMVWVLHRFPRTRDVSENLVPAQSEILAAWGASLIALVCAGSVFVLLIGGVTSVDQPLFVVASFAAAWTIGFLAVPIPSGLGVREAVLVALLHDSFPSSIIVATSVYQRLVTLAAEGLLSLFVARSVFRRHAARRAPREVVSDADHADHRDPPEISRSPDG